MALSLEHQTAVLESFLEEAVSVLAEVFRLKSILPSDIEDESSNYRSVFMDFSYFANPAEFDQKIEDNSTLKALDEEFGEQFKDYINHFSQFMSRLCSLIFEFSEYTQKYSVVENFFDLTWGNVHTLRSEILYHIGVTLVFLDQKFSHSTRETLFVASQRFGEKFTSIYFDTSISLLRERKDSFEHCFVYIGIDKKFVDNVIHYTRTYNLVQSDPTFAVKKNALIYICLWFLPNALREDLPLMRQLVDYFFSEEWIVSLHFELTANLFEKWKNCKAAITALNGVLTNDDITVNLQKKMEMIKSNKLPSGLLQLNEFDSYKKVILSYNHAIKWIILHSKDERCKKHNVTFDVFNHLMKLVRFEYKFKTSASYIVKNKKQQFESNRNRILATLEQIVMIVESARDHQKHKIKSWLQKIQSKLSDLEVDSKKALNVIEMLRLKIEEISEMTSENQKVIGQYLTTVLGQLDSLTTVYQLDNSSLGHLDTLCNSDYLWKCMRMWTEKLEDLLRADPVMVKYLFFKLMSSINVRLHGVKDEKKEMVSTFYHKILESYLKVVVQAIPRSVFIELDELQALLSDDEACFIEKANIKAVFQTEQRRKLAEKTCKISKLSLGISNMCLNKLGPVKIKPEDMLYDGLRKELRQKLQSMMKAVVPSSSFFTVIKQQREEISKLRKAFLFVCQQIGINGVQVWQTEIAQITVESLNSAFAKLGSEKLSMPLKTTTFDAFVIKMLQSTNPRATVFSMKSTEWWNQAKNKLEYTTVMFLIAHKWIPSFLLVGLRRIIQNFMSIHINELGALLMKNQNIVSTDNNSVDVITKSQEFVQFYNQCLPIIVKIGQYEVLNEALEVSINEHSTSEVNLLRATAKTALNYIQLIESKGNADSNVNDKFEKTLEKAGLLDYSNLVTPLPPYSKHSNAILVFCLLSHCLSTNVITSKKSEFVDSHASVKGIEKVVLAFELNHQFSSVLPAMCGESAGFMVAKKLCLDNIIYPYKNTPEPFLR
ncbi:unnamed protein product [Bursaphelenchus okinawaensis]|uniref:WASH complex subunit strumpellin n=1 Tax=Bursaphelenchus okinawaensis TaxID=465554 RepID=A0A811JUL8_9BILA|nr:unnamed protein product [Bursaphelenchus okinawaensis]CAG9083172.1 unnamed protein product [Bursaphelenchus okinawaensis]